MKYLLIFIVFFTGCTTLKNEVVILDEEYVRDSLIVEGMMGPENILLDSESSRFYVTDCEGWLYLIDGKNPKILNRVKVGDFALGLGLRGDELYFGAVKGDWKRDGGAIYKASLNLDTITLISDNYPGLNGLTIVGEKGYFTVGSFNPFSRDGVIYSIDLKSYKVEPVITKLSSPNGITTLNKGEFLYTQTFKGVYLHNIENRESKKIFGKSRMVEGFDDIALDSTGRVWCADQPNGFIKSYKEGDPSVTYYRSPYIGVASSCRIRVEDGVEYLYVTEIKQSVDSKEYNGRGVCRFSIKELISGDRFKKG